MSSHYGAFGRPLPRVQIARYWSRNRISAEHSAHATPEAIAKRERKQARNRRNGGVRAIVSNADAPRLAARVTRQQKRAYMGGSKKRDQKAMGRAAYRDLVAHSRKPDGGWTKTPWGKLRIKPETAAV